MPYRDTLIIAAFVVFLLAVPPLPVRINLVALGLALTTLALYLCPARARKGAPVPFEVRVDVDTTAIQAVLATLKQPALGQVAARALNDTARNGQVQATKHVAPLPGVKSRTVKESFSIAPARPSSLQAALIASGKPIPLIESAPATRAAPASTCASRGRPRPTATPSSPP